MSSIEETKRTLVIGNKCWSSWSMRPWLALRHGDITFEERMVWLRRNSSTP